MGRIIIVLLFLVLLAGGAFWVMSPDQTVNRREIDVAAAMGGNDTAGYARALHPRSFQFPADHGPHPGFKTEWWYATGNLHSSDGRRFGYQFTIFRNALVPHAKEGKSNWSTGQLYMGHFALSDIDGNRYFCFERFSRGANGLAGARANPLKIWLENWQITGDYSPGDSANPRLAITATSDNLNLTISMTPAKPLVLQGNKGLSQKGAGAGNASYYYSFTRLRTSGKITIDETEFDVEGWSWLDREWSTSALSGEQAGWDWFSLQLSDSTEIMYYQLRKKDGSADRFSKGILVDPQGKGELLGVEDVMLEVTDFWDSPRGGRYPAGWILTAASQQLNLQITPMLADQEMLATVRYWEGAVNVSGKRSGKKISGRGYVELTGYATP